MSFRSSNYISHNASRLVASLLFLGFSDYVDVGILLFIFLFLIGGEVYLRNWGVSHLVIEHDSSYQQLKMYKQILVAAYKTKLHTKQQKAQLLIWNKTNESGIGNSK